MRFDRVRFDIRRSCLLIVISVLMPTIIAENGNISESDYNSLGYDNTSTIFIHKNTDKNAAQKTFNYKYRWKSILNVLDTCNKDIIFTEIQPNLDTDKRIVSEIEDNLMTNNFNSSSEFITKDNLAEDYITIKTHMIDDDEFKESKFQSVDVSTSVRNATINEDIPSFREWTKKQLEEAEKQPATNETKYNHNKKILKKNYASPECGAKVVSTNPEAKYPHLLLTKPSDEYLLNLCKSTTWFVVELCEAIQVKKIEIANFELFSSTPKEFSVYVASRLNARVWTPIANLVAEDVRILQGFILNTTDENEFNKYIKVEINSHYGKEHYCPISVFNAYGLSEIEVLERSDENGLEINIAENEDNDDFDALNEEIQNNRNKSMDSKNTLLDSARVAVMSIVKIAADVLDIRQKNTNHFSNYTLNDNIDNITAEVQLSKCITPGYIMVCHSCNDTFYKQMFDTISCEADHLTEMYKNRYIHNTIMNSDACVEYGLDFLTIKKKSQRKISLISDRRKNFILSLFPRVRIAALCNTLAIVHKKIVLNKAKRVYISDNLIINLQASIPDENESTSNNSTTKPQQSKNDTSYSDTTDDNKSSVYLSSYIEPIISQILPTKTFLSSDEDPGSSNKYYVKESATVINENATLSSSSNTELNSTNEVPIPSSTQFETSYIVEKPIDSELQNNIETNITNEGTIVEPPSDTFDSFFKDFEVEEQDNDKCNPTAAESLVHHTVQPSVQSQNTKQSLFIRLANRIKDLERNMSLSGEYLQELSTRYKKQVDDMQRTILELTEENRMKREQDLKIYGEIKFLSDQVASLQNSLHCLKTETENLNLFSVIVPESNPLKIGIICLLISTYILLRITGIIGKKNQELEWKNSNTGLGARRQSTNDISSNIKEKHRRPSEEALFSSGTTHQDLLIRNNNGENIKIEKKRKKKRKELILKSKSNAINLEAGGIDSNIKLKSISSLSQSNRRASSSDLTTCNGSTHDFIKTALSVRNKRSSGPLQHTLSVLDSNINKNVTETKSKSIKTFFKKIF
ncbi:uncharacterized protein LOC132935729 [Metopolophium dirhodum]|uniref:uncharacterized protein LOC132935729 n=1 Tax=Metopolophium dirhodum TaxID=44670 RepID=UPI00298F9DC7|nr:uncharacterized protein LOC132935729 [Metopolophium dirhodum]